jgi:hypothetical protein
MRNLSLWDTETGKRLNSQDVGWMVTSSPICTKLVFMHGKFVNVVSKRAVQLHTS